MSISSATRKAGPYIGNGATTSFPFNFKVFQTSDVRVVQTDLNGVETDLVPTSAFTVALNTDQDATPGGTVNLLAAPLSGYLITLTSQVANLQPVTLTNSGGFYPAVLNDEFDRQVIQIQQLAEEVSRSVKVQISSNVSPDDLIAQLTSDAANAVNAANAASGSASAASGSASAASTSASAAATSASEAATSASEAATSASEASTSASEASTSASEASTSASEAATSASEAATSASEAATSASAAATSASAAATSASAAATSATNAESALSVLTTGFKNRIINGDMRIDQRNNGAAQTIPAGPFTYCVDRMYVYSEGSVVTGQQVAGTLTPFKYQITGAAGITTIQFGQRIESANIADLAGKMVTISAVLSNSLLTSVDWNIKAAGNKDNFSTFSTVALGSLAVSPTETKYSFQVALPSSAVNGIEIVFYANNQTSGTFTITNLQLEEGAVATPFEVRDIGSELARCQRYYEILESSSGGYTSNGINEELYGTFKATKRAVPSIVEKSVKELFGVGSRIFNQITTTGYKCYFPSTVTGDFYFTQEVTADAEL